ncbi:MAG TPA: Uma2 family endonuclease [Pyrinomonadaceae bacterium]|nr:Uma2 family endonuclease [Pyrinomonadaceae bacterium]
MSAELQKWHFNVDQYYRLAEVGVLNPDDRVELIEGEIIRMSPIGTRHASSVAKLLHGLTKMETLAATFWVQNPVRLDTFSEPVPDVALLKPRHDFYAERHPTSEDVLLIIEIADTTVLTDRNVKVPLYARFRIPEVWRVNLPKKLVEVYSDPTDGPYRKQSNFQIGDTITSPTIPGLTLKVDDIIA